jgi:hypothetical protein
MKIFRAWRGKKWHFFNDYTCAQGGRIEFGTWDWDNKPPWSATRYVTAEVDTSKDFPWVLPNGQLLDPWDVCEHCRSNTERHEQAMAAQDARHEYIRKHGI